MDHHQGFVIGVRSRWRPVEGSRDHLAVVDHGELVMQFVAAGEAAGSDAMYLQCFEGSAQWCSGLSWVRKPEPKPGGHLISR